MTGKRIKIACWNVNGLRACLDKGFLSWVEQEKPTVLGLQEVRAAPSQLPADVLPPRGFKGMQFSQAVKKGYSGTALFSRTEPVDGGILLGNREFDDEGRVSWMDIGPVLVFNAYFPKGSGTQRDNSRVPYKLAFYEALFAFARAQSKKRGKPLVVMGDYNTAHNEIDLANPRTNRDNSGFLPEERADLQRHLDAGFVDTFRALHPEKVQYSWWSQRLGARARNVGWRIDMVWVSRELLPAVKSAFIRDDVTGSDHAPVGITLEA